MDLFEFNKIVGAILGAGLVIFAINEIGNWLASPSSLEKSVYTVALEEEAEEAVPETAADEPPADEPPAMAALLASGDIEAGRKTAKKCAACHTFDQGGRKKVGPNLWGVVGGAKARADGFSYSSALAQLGGTWGYDELDRYLTRPKDYIPGTKMAFNGIKKPTDRANIILFLRSLSDSPLPLPEAD